MINNIKVTESSSLKTYGPSRPWVSAKGSFTWPVPLARVVAVAAAWRSDILKLVSWDADGQTFGRTWVWWPRTGWSGSIWWWWKTPDPFCLWSASTTHVLAGTTFVPEIDNLGHQVSWKVIGHKTCNPILLHQQHSQAHRIDTGANRQLRLQNHQSHMWWQSVNISPPFGCKSTCPL